MLIDLQRLRINDMADMQIQRLWLGYRCYPVLIIDNFYRDPDHVREVAMGLHYLPPKGRQPGYVAMLSLGMELMLEFLHACYADFYFPLLEDLQRAAHP